jgi:MoaA/NifB/PqqE/SkfB family radical SAM enzyme
MDRLRSYTSSGIFPVKVLKYPVMDNGQIKPVHVQLNPTNICNLDCGFCSCASRKKDISLPLQSIEETMIGYRHLGCEAVTITGGGEPLLHSDINKIVQHIRYLGIKIGLVTNGTKFNKLKDETYRMITWIRVSSNDTIAESETWKKEVIDAVITSRAAGAKVDWAISHVITERPSIAFLRGVIAMANEYQFTHVRLVSDLLNVEKIPQMSEIEALLKAYGVDDSLVIYQGRKEYTNGRRKCLISLLKPVVGADGYLYPCCGAQYAKDPPGLDYEDSMRMGHIEDIKRIYNEQEHYDGSECVRCYYDGYNDILGKMTGEVEHGEFV